jgi:alpha-beta hydrolase superfamily lysophospholipase
MLLEVGRIITDRRFAMASYLPSPAGPDTVVLIHGLWMTALSWEHWIDRYESRGYRVVARSWPGMEGDIDELRRDPSSVAGLGITEIVDHYEKIIRDLDSPPIVIGHSFGGLVAQILLDRGLGAAGVAIASAPVKGILFLPFSTLKVSFPALRNPANDRRAVPLTPEQFHYAFTNALSEDESLTVYERYAVPGPDHVLFQAGLANFNPHAASTVNFHNDDRAPLLLMSGGHDHISPPSVVRANFNLYRKARAVTDYKEYPERTHYTLGEAGWEQVADFSLDWAVRHATADAIKRQAVSITMHATPMTGPDGASTTPPAA